jgi:hypothetical protein
MALSKMIFFTAGSVDSSDYEATLTRVLPANSEMLLMLAVLEEAIDCYKRFLFAKDRKGQSFLPERNLDSRSRRQCIIFL